MTGYMAFQATISLVLLIIFMVIEKSSANCRCGVEGINNSNNGNRVSGGAEINPVRVFSYRYTVAVLVCVADNTGLFVAKSEPQEGRTPMKIVFYKILRSFMFSGKQVSLACENFSAFRGNFTLWRHTCIQEICGHCCALHG